MKQGEIATQVYRHPGGREIEISDTRPDGTYTIWVDAAGVELFVDPDESTAYEYRDGSSEPVERRFTDDAAFYRYLDSLVTVH